MRRARGAATTIRTRWQWTIAGEVVTFAIAGTSASDLGEPLAPQRAFKRIFGWFPPHASSRAGELQFAEMASRVAMTSHDRSVDLDTIDVATAVREGRLLVFTNLCDAAGARTVRLDRPLPEIDAPTGDLFALAPFETSGGGSRCEVVALDVAGYGRREPDPRQRLLQVVAMPDALTSEALTADGAINKSARQVYDLVSLLRRQRDRKSLSRLLGSYKRAQKARGDDEDGGPSLSAKWTTASSGHALVDVRPRNGSPCARHRAYAPTSGVTTRMLANRESVLRLQYLGPEPADARSLDVRPTRSHLAVRGCEGEERGVDIEVFPGAQRITSFEFSDGDDGPSLLKGALGKLLKQAGFECGFEFSGSVETFEGWRDCEGDWRVENVAQVTANTSITLHASVELSALRAAAHVPRSLTDLLGDVTFTADFFVCLQVEGTVCRRDRPPAGDAPAERSARGALSYALKGGVELTVEGRIGNDVLGVSASGSATPELRGTGAATFDGDRCKGTLAITAAECEFEVEVCLRTLVWRRSREWHFPLWDEHEFWRGEHQFYPEVRAVEVAS